MMHADKKNLFGKRTSLLTLSVFMVSQMASVCSNAFAMDPRLLS